MSGAIHISGNHSRQGMICLRRRFWCDEGDVWSDTQNFWRQCVFQAGFVKLSRAGLGSRFWEEGAGSDDEDLWSELRDFWSDDEDAGGGRQAAARSAHRAARAPRVRRGQAPPPHRDPLQHSDSGEKPLPSGFLPDKGAENMALFIVTASFDMIC